LRQQVLEDRGWVIHRIWSTDWFNQPQEQLRQVLAAIEHAKIEWVTRQTAPEEQCTESTTSDNDVDISRHEATVGQAPVAGAVAAPYIETVFHVDTTRQIHELTAKELATIVGQIVKAEGPIHQDEVARRVASLWGCKRTGNRIVEAVDRALSEAAFFGVVEQSGPFFKPKGQVVMPVRDRSNVSSPNLLKPEYLPPDEIRAAVTELVRTHFGMTQNETVIEVATVLGFRRTGPQLKQVVADEIQLMISDQVLFCRNDKLYSVKAENGQRNESRSVG
jgi:hypothetical protein